MNGLGVPNELRGESEAQMKSVLKVALLLATAVGLMSGAASASVVMEKVLKDGTKVQIQGDRLFILDGSKRTPAKDGDYTLQDGKTLKVQGGRILPSNFRAPTQKMTAKPKVTQEDKEHKPITKEQEPQKQQ